LHCSTALNATPTDDGGATYPSPPRHTISIHVYGRIFASVSQMSWQLRPYNTVRRYRAYACIGVAAVGPTCVNLLHVTNAAKHYTPMRRTPPTTPSPTHSFTLGLNPSFSAYPPYRSLSFFSFKIHYMDFADCLLLLLSISVFLLFSFFLFLHIFSCRFRAVD